jgi:hypothetical protein
MRRIVVLAVALFALSLTWAAPALAQACYGESYSSYSYGGGACYSGSYGYGVGTTYYATGPAYGGPLATVGSRLAYRAFHPFAGVRGRFAARRALRGTWVAGGACYSEGYGGACYSASYGGFGCYSASYGGGYASYYAAPVHYHVAPMAYATPAYASAYQPATWAASSVGPAPVPAPAPAPSPQAGTHPCPCGDAACNHTLGSCPCTDPACKCHLPGPTPAPAPAPVAPHHPGKAVKP